MKFLQELGWDLLVTVSGFAGGLYSLNKSPNLTMKQKVITVLSGGLVATYITPLVILFLGKFIKNVENVSYGVGFVVGYLGLKSIELLISKIVKK